ncbi:MAG: ABC transporter permease subunit, partial [candidate division WOR-3 bacterium]
LIQRNLDVRAFWWLGGSGIVGVLLGSWLFLLLAEQQALLGLILGVMVLPTIISISLDALHAVPQSYKEGSLALGATRWQTMYRTLLPAARSGIIAGLVLGMGRAVGETMAVIMVAGNAIAIPRSLLEPVRTLTSNIALEMGYASGDHQAALFATGMVLFVITMILNSVALLAIKRE